MPLNIPISSPLTDTQAELTSKIGSMKSLLSLPIDVNLKIPKGQQISTFDYLMKVLKALGVEPELIFNLFLDKVFDETGTFLEETVIKAVADSLGEKGRQLPSTNNPTATDAQKKEYKKNNADYLLNLVPTNFLQVYKQQLAKNLTMMIFGPKDGPTAEYLNPSPSERDRLFEDAICGENLFSLSSDPIVLQQDVEYNRIALRKQLEQGQMVFNINCQNVKIELPEDPKYIFEGGGQFTVSSTTPSPSQSLQLLVQYTRNSTQRINNEQNANSAGKSFFEILLVKLLNYISSLVFPFLGPIFNLLVNDSAAAGLDASTVAYSNCSIMNSDGASDAKEKQEFFRSLVNALLKELLRMLLVFAIKEFKKMVANYFAKLAIEKQKRRAEKIKQKFEIFNSVGQAAEALSKAQRYAAAATSLAAILGDALSQ